MCGPKWKQHVCQDVGDTRITDEGHRLQRRFRVQRIMEIPKRMRERLKEVEQIANVRGRGFLLGLEFVDKAKPIHEALVEHKIITGTSSDANVLRLLPPLCLKKAEVDLFIESLRKVI